MASNLNLFFDSSLYQSIDAMIYCQMLISLMCLMNTRPNICFVINTLIQFLMDSRHVHIIAAKHVLRYLKGTIECGIKYDIDYNINLHGYIDSYCAYNATNRKRTSGCCFSFEYGMISQFSRKQSCVVLSKAKVEYIAFYSTSSEAV